MVFSSNRQDENNPKNVALTLKVPNKIHFCSKISVRLIDQIKQFALKNKKKLPVR